MLRLTWIEFFLRTLPETFILIWGIHVISKKSINIAQYTFSSIILAILSFFIRYLPIYFGVHMIINIILTISIMAIIGIQLIKSIYSTLLITFVLSLSEFLNMIILRLVNMDTSVKNLNPFIKCIYGVPALIIFLICIVLMNYLSKMKEGIKDVAD